MVGHLHLQGMGSLKEQSHEGQLDSPDSGLPPSPSPSPPFYTRAPGLLDSTRAGGPGAASETPRPGEARAVRIRLSCGNRGLGSGGGSGLHSLRPEVEGDVCSHLPRWDGGHRWGAPA